MDLRLIIKNFLKKEVNCRRFWENKKNQCRA
jgi:hypothetical protein